MPLIPRTPKLGMVGVALTLIVTGSLVACGTSTPPTATTPSPGVQASGTRTVVDTTGRHVQIPNTVTRVGTDIPLIPPMISLLGGMSKLVYRPNDSSSLFETIYPAIKNMPSSPAPSINDEELLKAHPQVFIVTSFAQNVLPTLTRLGIPYVEVAAFNDPTQLEAGVNLVADVLGGTAPARAKQFTSYYNGNVTLVQSRIAPLPASSRPTVYYGPGPDTTTTVGTGNIITASINEAGGRNIAAEHGLSQGGGFAFPTINAEQLVTWNPQVIIAISAKIQQQFTSSPQYTALGAIRNHRVYACPAGIGAWCASGPEAALQPLWIAKTLHPELFSDLDLAAAVKDFYSKFYSYQLSDRQVSGILSGSA